MTKAIIKEIGIVMLLLIAVALILGILFYDYIPTSKPLPTKMESYVLPEDIKQELDQSKLEGQNIVKTYYIDNAELGAYESAKDYNKGKSNPFASYDTSNNQSENNTSSGNTSGNTNSGVLFNTTGK